MLYNGVELPAYPSDYDTSVFTSQYWVLLNVGTDQYLMFLSNAPFRWGGTAMVATGNANGRSYGAEVGYEEWYFAQATNWVAGTSMSQGMTPVWASYDILNEDGSVYLAASEPVDPNEPAEPTYTYDRTAFLSGMAMGLCGKGNPTFTATDTFGKGYLVGAKLRAKRRIPTAYSYNGTVLPKLPERDKEKYPYAYVVHGSSVYKVRYCSVPLVALNLSQILSNTFETLGEYEIDYTLENGEWVDENYAGGCSAVWSNTDIYYDDSLSDVGGTLAMAASDPVPVYE